MDKLAIQASNERIRQIAENQVAAVRDGIARLDKRYDDGCIAADEYLAGLGNLASTALIVCPRPEEYEEHLQQFPTLEDAMNNKRS